MKDKILTILICLIIIFATFVYINQTIEGYRDDCDFNECFKEYYSKGFDSKALNDTTDSYQIFLFMNYYPRESLLHALYRADYLEIPEDYSSVYDIMNITLQKSFVTTSFIKRYLQKGAELGNSHCIYILEELNKKKSRLIVSKVDEACIDM